MDAQHDLVGLQAWMVLIQYSVYEIYQYMQIEHYFFFIIQETVYFVFFYKNILNIPNILALHWRMTYVTYEDE